MFRSQEKMLTRRVCFQIDGSKASLPSLLIPIAQVLEKMAILKFIDIAHKFIIKKEN